MLLARDLPVEDVVEEELIHHRRDHHVDLPPRQVDQHALEPADLARHVESHSGGILSRAIFQIRQRQVVRSSRFE